MGGGHLLALKEVARPYPVDPLTLETRCYDPFGQVKAKTFSAHPKYDPYNDELVVFGYEAKGGLWTILPRPFTSSFLAS
ncbi:hypothetical protein CLAFUW4_07301 [Fulvia fulva]|uniref:Uncharacterized protein n=1 Tax=Passalora fulva TaxID=5499 RepID=A0A9Q8UQY4_PASFU|nr:uncharacterized protein CLAFUR5_07431 [Fulvia fulva]UJO19239.1 hypothetical protein CLAFUR5_07431 [Fulvia fulva]WPV16692.1 hypothetical protein CLAFUW4_07301 [Fulvia fulva]